MIYREKPVEIPMPRFVVLYNGREDLPEHSVQRLSDSYKRIYAEKQECVPLELNVDVFNINYEKASNLIQQSESLKEYSMFIHLVKENQKTYESLDEAIEQAIRYCVNHGIMQEFLEENGSEVCNMLYTEWDWDKYIEIHKEEAYEDGIKEGEQRSKVESIRKFSRICTPEQIAETLQIPLEYVFAVLKEG